MMIFKSSYWLVLGRPLFGRRFEANEHDAYMANRYYFLWIKVWRGRDYYVT